jgi:hypothetical protein
MPRRTARSRNVGDFWQLSVNPNSPFGLLVIKPGQTRTITVTINPAKAMSATVHGNLYLDDFVPAPGNVGGNEIIGSRARTPWAGKAS